ncbi:hypothetical protein [Formosa sp. PL04]|uniref:hypothetical protein n=1 Tax=Formosa sp. PL04 TaxID=3081755 RepID=UPI002981D6A3|nr:hypothetical protein [Formosa sp. PL04]MDW5289601.1 hypothetical protein [Formosa sp. PL04]
MKKAVKFSGVLLLTVLYCFALYSVAQPLPKTFIVNSNPSEQQQKVSTVTKSLFNLTSESENLSVSFNPSPGPFLKIPLFESGWHSKLNEQLVLAQISQYTKHQTNTLVKYRKTDSIFPFHYFW